MAHAEQVSGCPRRSKEKILGTTIIRRGRYSLATRTMLELGNYLAQTYGEDVMIDCVICQEVACHKKCL